MKDVLVVIRSLPLLLLLGCSPNSEIVEESKYLRWVGDIEFDDDIDDATFQLCFSESEVYQYFNFSQGMKYKGERTALNQKFIDLYKPVHVEESGMVRIRFIVNCKGETGRFRVISADENYQPFNFNTKITGQLLEITKSLDGWIPLPDTEEPKDYYQYLVFKISNGAIHEILP